MQPTVWSTLLVAACHTPVPSCINDKILNPFFNYQTSKWAFHLSSCDLPYRYLDKMINILSLTPLCMQPAVVYNTVAACTRGLNPRVITTLTSHIKQVKMDGPLRFSYKFQPFTTHSYTSVDTHKDS